MVVLQPRVDATPLLLLLLYELVGCVSGQSETSQESKEEGLESGDKAAIALGALLLLVALLIIVLCILYQKGYIGRKEPEKGRVAPIVMGFSTSPEKLKAQTIAAIEMEKQVNTRKSKEEKLPTIYIFDDIYHPPKSRPLPTDSPVPNGKPAMSSHSSKQRTKMSENKARDKLSRKRDKVVKKEKVVKECRFQNQQTPRARGYADESSCSSKSVSVNGHIIYPDNGRMNFTTHYETARPYK